MASRRLAPSHTLLNMEPKPASDPLPSTSLVFSFFFLKDDSDSGLFSGEREKDENLFVHRKNHLRFPPLQNLLYYLFLFNLFPPFFSLRIRVRAHTYSSRKKRERERNCIVLRRHSTQKKTPKNHLFPLSRLKFHSSRFVHFFLLILFI